MNARVPDQSSVTKWDWCTSAPRTSKEQGYAAQKWLSLHGSMSGFDGLRMHLALVETLGEDSDIMLDCCQSITLDYPVALCERIEQCRPRRLEEASGPTASPATSS